MKREFTAVYEKQGRWINAWIEEIPGVNTQGKTMREARANLKDALSLILEVNKNLSFGKAVGIKRETLSIVLPA
ncbi:MAG: type II toxin-antitoxin system HicB family antitoxin [Candidatus Pacebacteria bacterium]|nr:type II toxin-antitoxin system HicB family antitoxin [Candidatus Paceibacterota bacterium]